MPKKLKNIYLWGNAPKEQKRFDVFSQGINLFSRWEYSFNQYRQSINRTLIVKNSSDIQTVYVSKKGETVP